MTTSDDLVGAIINQYRIIKLIGTGAYGLVFLVEDYYTHKQYAVKIISKRQFKHNNTNQSDVLLKKLANLLKDYNSMLTDLNSIDLLKLKNYNLNQNNHNLSYLKELIIHLKVHNHPNVITIHEILDSSLCLFTVMDYFPEGDLFHNIVDNQLYLNSKPSLIKSVFIQLIDVISYCHSKNIYHCDLKPENIMCASNGEKLLIGDFGLSVMEKNINVKTCIGSSYYMPPERLITANNNVDYDSNDMYPAGKGDFWSLCIILINLTCMRNPWMKACYSDHTYLNFLKNSKVLKEILPINDKLYQILQISLKEDPFKRISLFKLRDLISNCDSFTINGPLSIPDVIETPVNSIYNECVIPRSPTNSQDEIKLITEKVNNNYVYYKEILNDDFTEKSKNFINSINIMNNEEQLEHYSILTNASFNINEGYFNGTNINGYFNHFNVK